MILSDKKYNVEHALSLYAYSHVIAPAEAIYEPRLRDEFSDPIKHCHIYLIGLMPEIEIDGASLVGDIPTIQLTIEGKPEKVEMPTPPGSTLVTNGDAFYLTTAEGVRIQPSDNAIFKLLHEQRKLVFEVQYVGQAYGKDGKRNALDRLLKHETLQKIALKGVPKNKRLQLLLLQIHPENSIITQINPHAKDGSTSEERIDAGLRKLYNTSEQERITLYEASLIRYFRPKFNIEFKDSFPSTNLSVLKDCYEKDFSSIVAEIAFPDLHLLLSSEAVPPSQFHMAVANLHNDEERRIFFLGQ